MHDEEEPQPEPQLSLEAASPVTERDDGQHSPGPLSPLGAASPLAARRRDAILRLRAKRMELQKLNDQKAAAAGEPSPPRPDYATVYHGMARSHQG